MFGWQCFFRYHFRAKAVRQSMIQCSRGWLPDSNFSDSRSLGQNSRDLRFTPALLWLKLTWFSLPCLPDSCVSGLIYPTRASLTRAPLNWTTSHSSYPWPHLPEPGSPIYPARSGLQWSPNPNHQIQAFLALDLLIRAPWLELLDVNSLSLTLTRQLVSASSTDP